MVRLSIERILLALLCVIIKCHTANLHRDAFEGERMGMMIDELLNRAVMALPVALLAVLWMGLVAK
jgi:hypothetical protein